MNELSNHDIQRTILSVAQSNNIICLIEIIKNVKKLLIYIYIVYIVPKFYHRYEVHTRTHTNNNYSYIIQ